MKILLKTAVVVLPFLLLFFGIRACAGGAAGRWQARIAEVDPGAKIIEDEDDRIVIASDIERGAMVGRSVAEFRAALIEEFGDLLGRGREQRTVVVLFSSVQRLQKYWDGSEPIETGRSMKPIGFTQPLQNAIFLPPDSTLDTMRHETVHLLMEETQGGRVRYSPWLLEGLAQLFQAYDPDTQPPTPPGITLDLRQAIAVDLQTKSIDVHRLLTLQDYAEFTGAEAARNYLEALVLTAFLYERRERAQLREYIEGERAYDTGRDALFSQVYRYRDPSFQAQLIDYLRVLKQGGRRR